MALLSLNFSMMWPKCIEDSAHTTPCPVYYRKGSADIFVSITECLVCVKIPRRHCSGFLVPPQKKTNPKNPTTLLLPSNWQSLLFRTVSFNTNYSEC